MESRRSGWPLTHLTGAGGFTKTSLQDKDGQYGNPSPIGTRQRGLTRHEDTRKIII